MKKINLEKFKIPSNYVLIKPEPDFEFIKVEPKNKFSGESGPVEILIAHTTETHARHFSITGTVLVNPEKLIFNKKRIKDFKRGRANDESRREGVARLMEASLEIDVDIDTEVGDKVWFSYLCQLNAVIHKLIIDTEEHGICFLIKYEDIYCYQRKDAVFLINGWVWIKRVERSRKTDTGLELQFSTKNTHEPNWAIIIKSSNPVRDYMDSKPEGSINFNGGEQVIYNDKMGHPLEYGLHRELTDDEVLSVRRKHIYAVI